MGGASQKAANLARDDRVSATVDLAYRSWDEIRGVSLAGRARRVTDPGELARVGELFQRKFPQIAQLQPPPGMELVVFRIDLEVVSLLDYRKGFGHTDYVRRADLG